MVSSVACHLLAPLVHQAGIVAPASKDPMEDARLLNMNKYLGGPCWLATISWGIHFEEACRPPKRFGGLVV